MKKISNLKGAKTLSITEQKLISGGFWGWGGCQPQLIQCDTDNDCPCGPCGFVVDGGPAGPINFFDVCAF